MKEFNLGDVHRYLGREYRLDGIAMQPDQEGGLLRLEFTPLFDIPRAEPSNTSWAREDDICVCEGGPMHIHCPWGGEHVHYIDSEGNDVPPPEGHRHRAVFHSRTYQPEEKS
jgi:hypothetical protein